jgi:hypothetical protein
MPVMTKEPRSSEEDDAPRKGKRNRHRHPPYQVHLPTSLREQLEKLCTRNATKVSEEVRTAIRRHLEANGLWPPPAA